MRKSVKVLLFVIGLAIYLNIGWAFGTYFHNNVGYKSVESGGLVDKFLAGPGHLAQPPSISDDERHSLLHNQILFSVAWPIALVGLVAAWVIHSFYLLLWLIFAGGIAKLFRVG